MMKKSFGWRANQKQNLSPVFFVIPPFFFFFFYTYFLRFLVWRGFSLLFSLFPACNSFFLSFSPFPSGIFSLSFEILIIGSYKCFLVSLNSLTGVY
ncbi:hypothetical protein HOY80DRAFT_651866 [Tuber brumale]|nr:hypothetical protein HOY80DRAFT_651866 [Tuber brumale]